MGTTAGSPLDCQDVSDDLNAERETLSLEEAAADISSSGPQTQSVGLVITHYMVHSGQGAFMCLCLTRMYHVMCNDKPY